MNTPKLPVPEVREVTGDAAQLLLVTYFNHTPLTLVETDQERVRRVLGDHRPPSYIYGNPAVSR
jgi:hypothetical protein